MFQTGLSVLVCVCTERVIWVCPCWSVCFKTKKKCIALHPRACAYVWVCACARVSAKCKYLFSVRIPTPTPLDLFLTTKYPTGTLIILSHNPRLNMLPCGNAWWLVCENTVPHSPRSRRPRCIFVEGVLSRPLQSSSSTSYLSRLDKCPQLCREFPWNPGSWRFFAAVSLPGKSFKFGVNDHLMGWSKGWPNYKMSSQQQFAYKKHPSPGTSCIIVSEMFSSTLQVGFIYVDTSTKQDYFTSTLPLTLEKKTLRAISASSETPRSVQKGVQKRRTFRCCERRYVVLAGFLCNHRQGEQV